MNESLIESIKGKELIEGSNLIVKLKEQNGEECNNETNLKSL